MYPWIFKATQQCNLNLTWPHQANPSTQDLAYWGQFLRKFVCHKNGHLHQTLGKCILPYTGHVLHNFLYNHSTEQIYHTPTHQCFSQHTLYKDLFVPHPDAIYPFIGVPIEATLNDDCILVQAFPCVAKVKPIYSTIVSNWASWLSSQLYHIQRLFGPVNHELTLPSTLPKNIIAASDGSWCPINKVGAHSWSFMNVSSPLLVHLMLTHGPQTPYTLSFVVSSHSFSFCLIVKKWECSTKITSSSIVTLTLHSQPLPNSCKVLKPSKSLSLMS